MRAAIEWGLPVCLIRDANINEDLILGEGPKRRSNRIEFLKDDPISSHLVFTFSLWAAGLSIA